MKILNASATFCEIYRDGFKSEYKTTDFIGEIGKTKFLIDHRE